MSMVGKSVRCIAVDDMDNSLLQLAKEAGLELDYRPEITRSQLLEVLPSYHVLIIRSKTSVDRELLDACSNLRIIARAGAGLDLIDKDAVRAKGIHLVNAPEGNRDAVGEHTLGMLLALFAKICTADRQVRAGVWDREANRGIELKGKTVGIIGYGNMGKAFAQRLCGFECKVIAYDRYLEGFSDEYAEEVTLPQLMAQSDVISLHVPLTPETVNMVNEQFIREVEKPFFLINTARGELAELELLLMNLEKGKILGLCLDVLPNEKSFGQEISNSPIYMKLVENTQIIFTPHVAGWTQESYRKINETIINKIVHLISES